MAETKDEVIFHHGWKRSNAGGWNNVEIDFNVWCPCDVGNTATLQFSTYQTGVSNRNQQWGTATCSRCGRVFRAVVSIRIEEQEATNG